MKEWWGLPFLNFLVWRTPGECSNRAVEMLPSFSQSWESVPNGFSISSEVWVEFVLWLDVDVRDLSGLLWWSFEMYPKETWIQLQLTSCPRGLVVSQLLCFYFNFLLLYLGSSGDSSSIWAPVTHDTWTKFWQVNQGREDISLCQSLPASVSVTFK